MQQILQSNPFESIHIFVFKFSLSFLLKLFEYGVFNNDLESFLLKDKKDKTI